MALTDPARRQSGLRVRQAREDAKMSLSNLAARVETVRKQRGETPPERATLRQQIVRIEGGGSAGPMWRADLAEALGRDAAELFGLTVETSLPRPLLLQLPVDRDVLTVIADQRAVHIRAEHTFGPEYAQPLVERDLQTVEALIKSTPAELRTQVREVAGTIAEVAGWIAQDLGDHPRARELTDRAADHLRAAAPDLRAMVWMRKSNIIASQDPDLAVELAADAARLIDGHEVGRLQASITRQQALAAIANQDKQGFLRHAAHALELGDINPASDDRATYAHAGFVASDIAAGYLELGHPRQAVELLTRHQPSWTSHQHRDWAVADIRLLHALIAIREYQLACAHATEALRGYLAAPSQRARRHLARCATLLRDRRRHDKSPVLQQLFGQIKDAIEGIAS
ncbi:hypothetical protein [Mycobacterium sp. E3247]|uniref:hypothetical protein n=1 Tax=Mycobacterium sp. E3247 TaxID=1856864 RepID=UPI0008010AA4|nr:hypothetical protein [Mycobacterium sp. E3247]OBH15084.1 hypothetical protein A9X04_13355 [Mycobacterium sp. E3247]